MKKTNDSTTFKLVLFIFILFVIFIDVRLWITDFVPFAKIAGTFFLVIIAFIAALKIDQLNQEK